MRNIEAICPKIKSWIEVRDDWYPSYKINGKSYVEVYIEAYYHNQNYDMNTPYYGTYAVIINFSGADDTAITKVFDLTTFDEAVRVYKKYRHLYKKIKKMNTLNLKWWLEDVGLKNLEGDFE